MKVSGHHIHNSTKFDLSNCEDKLVMTVASGFDAKFRIFFYNICRCFFIVMESDGEKKYKGQMARLLRDFERYRE